MIKKFKKYIILIIAIILLVPNTSYAYSDIKTHSWKTTINATINTDGSIQVSEQRIIDITKFIEKSKKEGTKQQGELALNPLVWGFENFPQETDIETNGARIAILDNNDKVIGKWIDYPSTTYLSKWHYETPITNPSISYDPEYKQICLFTELVNPDSVTEQKAAEIMTNFTGSPDKNSWNSTKAIINLNYSIKKAPLIYKDVADFSWSYESSTWKEDSYNVDLKVTIPVGEQSIASPLGKVSKIPNATTERNMYAWGHGSSTGVVNLDSSGFVTLKNEIVPGDTSAEIRIVFPSAWLSNLQNGTNVTHANQTKLTQILKEESVWHDSRQNQVNKLIVPIVFISICIILMIISFIKLIQYKKAFKEHAVSNTKVQELNPCLLVRLKNWNQENIYEVIASVLHLHDLNKLTIKKLHSGDFKIKLKDKLLAKNPYKTRSIDDLDKQTINLLYTTCACGHFKITLYDLLNFAKVRFHEFLASYLTWHSVLTDNVSEITNFDRDYSKLRHGLFITSLLLGIVSIVLGIIFMDWITPVCGIFSSAIIAFIANNLRNKIYFKDSQEHVINAADIPIAITKYNEEIEEFTNKMGKILKEAVLTAQDKMN